ncbi:Magnesium transporter MRS2/LPE10 [Artemisia annua]|uniref:Magnesium transporter MRS2/LPE10 n=1 Tax=Artemisia annua TaxID=35608 RepID=A0A2U1NK33_ARTAN|nr:Magnesium transporter MRS2/LPE10 [Artemisia annua]
MYITSSMPHIYSKLHLNATGPPPKQHAMFVSPLFCLKVMLVYLLRMENKSDALECNEKVNKLHAGRFESSRYVNEHQVLKEEKKIYLAVCVATTQAEIPCPRFMIDVSDNCHLHGGDKVGDKKTNGTLGVVKPGQGSMLDDKQAHRLQMGVMLTTATLVVGSFVVAGVSRMNLGIDLFDTDTEEQKEVGMRKFLWTVGGGTTCSIFLYVVAMVWCKSKWVLEAARVETCEVVVQILRGCDNVQMYMNERRHDVFQLGNRSRWARYYSSSESGRQIPLTRRHDDCEFSGIIYLFQDEKVRGLHFFWTVNGSMFMVIDLDVLTETSDPWPRKVASDLGIANRSSHINGGSVSSVKLSFERRFPSLAADEKHVDSDRGRIPPSGLSFAIQSMSMGSSTLISGDGWTSALAKIPVIMECLMEGVVAMGRTEEEIVEKSHAVYEVLYSGSWDGTNHLWCLSDHIPLAMLGEEAPTCGSILSLAPHTTLSLQLHCILFPDMEQRCAFEPNISTPQLNWKDNAYLVVEQDCCCTGQILKRALPLSLKHLRSDAHLSGHCMFGLLYSSMVVVSESVLSFSKTPLFQVPDVFCNGVVNINAAVGWQRLQRQQQDSKSARLTTLGSMNVFPTMPLLFSSLHGWVVTVMVMPHDLPCDPNYIEVPYMLLRSKLSTNGRRANWKTVASR